MNGPILIRALGRTGGTLLNTIIDAHPDVAMSYEIYQDRLVPRDGDAFTTDRALVLLTEARDDDPVRWVRGIAEPNLKTFAARARRGAIEPDELIRQMEAHAAEGGTLATLDGRLDLIERLMRRRAALEGATRWGGKFARVDADTLHRRHPDAVFLAMVRDGRDVLASQLTVGNFNATPESVATDWVAMVTGFRRFIDREGVTGAEVPYEALVADPARVLRGICQLAGITFDSRMVAYESQSPALFDAPHGHLSHQQLQKGLNADSIGRWRRELTADQVDAFTRIAGTTLDQYGYAP